MFVWSGVGIVEASGQSEIGLTSCAVLGAGYAAAFEASATAAL